MAVHSRLIFNPSLAGAQVVVNGKQYGATPTTATLSRCESYEVTVQKAGYQPNHIMISRGVAGSDSILLFLDSVLIIPALVDSYNCALNLSPNPVVAQMSPVVSSAPPAAESPQVK